MDKKINKYIAVAYQLYTTEDGKTNLVEKTSDDKPFQFISGFGLTLDAFEQAIEPLAEGDNFDFTLEPAQAYGEHDPEHVVDLDKNIFSVNGHFDSDHIYKDAIVPLMNEDGNRFFGHVLAITDDKVKMDLNHPLAGKTLNFKGSVLASREATNEEIQSLISHMNDEGGCGGGCEGCGGGCGGHGHEESHCGGHHEGGCCGGHHEGGHCGHHHE